MPGGGILIIGAGWPGIGTVPGGGGSVKFLPYFCFDNSDGSGRAKKKNLKY